MMLGAWPLRWCAALRLSGAVLQQTAAATALAVAAVHAMAAAFTAEPLLRLETGMHTAPIARIATDSAGRVAVTVSDDKTARVWDVASGRALAVLRPPQDAGNEGKLWAVAMSPDGRWVAAAGWTGGDPGGRHAIYVFDRVGGQLVRRIDGLPNVVLHLAFSPDGRWIAASVGGNSGIRLFDAGSGAERGRDASYGESSYSVHFSGDSRRLVATSYDGRVRSYTVGEQGGLRLLAAAAAEGGHRPYAARFSPDGRRIAVGFADSGVVQVLDAQTLAEVARPVIAGVDTGALAMVAWSADGRSLLAGGLWNRDGKRLVRRWSVDDWSRYQDVPLSDNTITDLVALPLAAGGGWLFAAAEPSWGVLDGAARVLRQASPATADLRGQWETLRMSADGRRVRFGYKRWGDEPAVFDLGARTLVPAGAAGALQLARTTAPDVNVSDWLNDLAPKLNGKPLVLDRYERSRSLAITPDGKRFVLGTDWSLHAFDATGALLWTQAVPDVVWALNISADGRFVVAAYGDGTIRWHRLDQEGREVLAFFPHADRKRWVAWTPEGYFDASPGAEDLIGFHLNQGQDRESDFVSARQLWETFSQPGLIARRLDADGDRLLADQVRRRGDVRSLLQAGSVPELVLQSASEAQTDGSYLLAVRIRNAGSGGGKLVVRVDGVELAGRWTGAALTSNSVVTFPVAAAAGTHNVSAELVDSRFVGSKPVTARVTVVKPAAVPTTTLHVLAVGVSAYRDADLRLKYAADDARAVAERLALRGAAQFGGRVVTRTLLDAQATRAGIGKALAEMAARARPDDVFVLYMAGHGTTLSDGEYHFLPYELDYANDASVRDGAVSMALLREWLSRLPVRSLLLLDTCRAGNAVQLASRAPEEKGAFANLIRLSNRAVIVASSNDNMALEGYQGHGVFSWVVLDAIDHADYDENGSVDVTDIAIHVRRHVPAITERVFNYRQVPMQDTPGEPFAVAKPLPKGAVK